MRAGAGHSVDVKPGYGGGGGKQLQEIKRRAFSRKQRASVGLDFTQSLTSTHSFTIGDVPSYSVPAITAASRQLTVPRDIRPAGESCAVRSPLPRSSARAVCTFTCTSARSVSGNCAMTKTENLECAKFTIRTCLGRRQTRSKRVYRIWKSRIDCFEVFLD